MLVTIKSQCGKNALVETRRILDQFFERAGDRTWEGPVTLEGLLTIRKLLRKTARRNTAVACHRVRGSRQLELEWIIGNARMFNAQGRVPTNSTRRDVLKSSSENAWHTAEAMALMSGIAGLFHDFGKANELFQRKLKGKRGMQEPLRHEWLSLLLFVAFVNDESEDCEAKGDDQSWLSRLARIQPENDRVCRARLEDFKKDRRAALSNPFTKLKGRPLAQVIAWLVLSHHRLPAYPAHVGNRANEYANGGDRIPKLEVDALHIEHRDWFAPWNSAQCVQPDWTEAEWQQLFSFPQGTPISSRRWCDKAKQIARRALHSPDLIQGATDWLQQDCFTSHLARLVLMLADHAYSAGEKHTQWWDDNYEVYANTDKRDATGCRPLKQRLDEHNIGVGQNAFLLARQLPTLRSQLPTLVTHKTLKARTTLAAYRWQDKAYDVATGLAVDSQQNGFFGVNMASTGQGKTFANARIMYGLASAEPGCRFSVALGLRTLTLQTGTALRERLRLDTDELAVLVGSQAVEQLYRRRTAEEKPTAAEESGSESAGDLLDATQHIIYDGALDDGPLRRWLGQKSKQLQPSKMLKLLSAPVLVCTIDHLIPATEGVRGGKQIAPMLRLLTSDLVLDEPDDFDSADLPALCRLVNWAGMLGSRVLLSSASMPPVMLTALFSAYRAGRVSYNRSCGTSGRPPEICCAWFDEYSAASLHCVEQQNFKKAHKEFVSQRVKRLSNDLSPGKALRRGEVLQVTPKSVGGVAAIEALHESCWKGMLQLHEDHGVVEPKTGKRVSVGLIRMANINPLVALARQLIEGTVPEGHRLHLCVYHSQYPLLVRSHIEARLDRTLARHQPDELWQQAEIQHALATHPEKEHLFVVLGSPVTEVGRDHDYDWAIAEPSSMRSLIQLAGRVQRHRQLPPQKTNVLVLDLNYRALIQKGRPALGKVLVYEKPGFEAEDEQGQGQLKLHPDHWPISRCMDADDLAMISSIPRVQEPLHCSPGTSLRQIEHLHLVAALFKNSTIQLKSRVPADRWWGADLALAWHAEIQRLTPFRRSSPEDEYVYFQADASEQPSFHRIRESDGLLLSSEMDFIRPTLEIGAQCSQWLETDAATLITECAEALGREIPDISKHFCGVRLRSVADAAHAWYFHPWLGIFDDIDQH